MSASERLHRLAAAGSERGPGRWRLLLALLALPLGRALADDRGALASTCTGRPARRARPTRAAEPAFGWVCPGLSVSEIGILAEKTMLTLAYLTRRASYPAVSGYFVYPAAPLLYLRASNRTQRGLRLNHCCRACSVWG